MRTGRSLQLRLLVLLSVSMTVVWLAVAVWTWVDARHEVDELMDSHLAQAAAILVVQPLDLEDDAVADAPTLHKYGPRVAFQVFHEGTLVMRSANVGAEPLSDERRGFDTVRHEGESWRVFATRGAEGPGAVGVPLPGEPGGCADEASGAPAPGAAGADAIPSSVAGSGRVESRSTVCRARPPRRDAA